MGIPFYFQMYYNNREYYYHRDPGHAFGCFLLTLVLAAMLIFAIVYIGMIILYISLGIGCFIGFVYAIISYVRAHITAAKYYSVKYKGLGVVRRFTAYMKDTARDSLSENLYVAKGAFNRFLFHRFLSFRKWMWLVVAPSVLIFGTFTVLVFLMVELLILAFVSLFCLIKKAFN